MGKKGKKAAKVTGTPEVIKFKGTPTFAWLSELIAISETLPFVRSDTLDDFTTRKIARYLSMLGLLADFYKAEASKEYRFAEHHQLVAPVPQYFPQGYPIDVIINAREVMQKPSIKINDRDFKYGEDFPGQCDDFLEGTDGQFTKIAQWLIPIRGDDFAMGLKKFTIEFQKVLQEFDNHWCKFETVAMKQKLIIDSEVLKPVQNIVDIEKKLAKNEDEMDIEGKQEAEDEFVDAVETFTHTYFPETNDKMFQPKVLQMAEACLFYEAKMTPEYLDRAKHVIKDYLELRIYVANIPTARIDLNLANNMTFLRLLKRFWNAVIAAEDALVFVEQLPRIKFTKKEHWMTRKLVEPDILKMKELKM